MQQMTDTKRVVMAFPPYTSAFQAALSAHKADYIAETTSGKYFLLSSREIQGLV
jgi:hypothetical protein